MKKYLLPVMTLLFVCTPVLAEENKGGLFIEPMITYEQGDGEIDYPSPFGTSDTTSKGFGIGGRLGFHVHKSVFLGVDGRYSSLELKVDGSDTKSDAKAWNFGPMIGIQMPTTIALRVWASYIMDGQIDPEKDNGFDVKFEDGTGYRVGAGLKLGIASLNLEYQNLTYDKTRIQAVGNFGTNSVSSTSLENNTWIASVSFPIGL
jgi:hypothetical protein